MQNKINHKTTLNSQKILWTLRKNENSKEMNIFLQHFD